MEGKCIPWRTFQNSQHTSFSGIWNTLERQEHNQHTSQICILTTSSLNHHNLKRKTENERLQRLVTARTPRGHKVTDKTKKNYNPVKSIFETHSKKLKVSSTDRASRSSNWGANFFCVCRFSFSRKRSVKLSLSSKKQHEGREDYTLSPKAPEDYNLQV